MANADFCPKAVRATDHSGSACPEVPAKLPSRDVRAKRPYEPPVIETLPPRAGLPPDVINEWSGERPRDSDAGENEIDQGAPQARRRARVATELSHTE